MNRDDSIGDRCGAILNEAWRLISGSPVAVMAYLIVMIGLAVMTDIYISDGRGAVGLSIVDVAAVFVLTVHLIQSRIEGGKKGQRGILSYIGLYLLSGIAIGIGFLLLVLPGLILLSRWAAAYGYMLGNGESVTSAMEESWDATTGHTVPVMFALLVSVLFTVTGVAVAYYFSDEYGVITLAGSIISNLLVYFSSVLSVTIGLAVFSLLARQDVEVAAVFE